MHLGHRLPKPLPPIKFDGCSNHHLLDPEVIRIQLGCQLHGSLWPVSYSLALAWLQRSELGSTQVNTYSRLIE